LQIGATAQASHIYTIMLIRPSDPPSNEDATHLMRGESDLMDPDTEQVQDGFTIVGEQLSYSNVQEDCTSHPPTTALLDDDDKQDSPPLVTEDASSGDISVSEDPPSTPGSGSAELSIRPEELTGSLLDDLPSSPSSLGSSIHNSQTAIGEEVPQRNWSPLGPIISFPLAAASPDSAQEEVAKGLAVLAESLTDNQEPPRCDDTASPPNQPTNSQVSLSPYSFLRLGIVILFFTCSLWVQRGPSRFNPPTTESVIQAQEVLPVLNEEQDDMLNLNLDSEAVPATIEDLASITEPAEEIDATSHGQIEDQVNTHDITFDQDHAPAPTHNRMSIPAVAGQANHADELPLQTDTAPTTAEATTVQQPLPEVQQPLPEDNSIARVMANEVSSGSTWFFDALARRVFPDVLSLLFTVASILYGFYKYKPCKIMVKEEFDLTVYEDMHSFLRDCKTSLRRNGRKSRSKAARTCDMDYDLSNYDRLSAEDLHKIMLQFQQSPKGNKQTIIVTLADRYEVLLRSYTNPQIKALHDVHNLKNPGSAKKAEMIKSLIEAGF
jgi:hypothetical protein